MSGAVSVSAPAFPLPGCRLMDISLVYKVWRGEGVVEVNKYVATIAKIIVTLCSLCWRYALEAIIEMIVFHCIYDLYCVR